MGLESYGFPMDFTLYEPDKDNHMLNPKTDGKIFSVSNTYSSWNHSIPYFQSKNLVCLKLSFLTIFVVVVDQIYFLLTVIEQASSLITYMRTS